MQLLREAIEARDIPIIAVRDPGSSRIGEQIRGILLNPENTDMAMRCEMLLYMAARAQLMRDTVLPALANGNFVVSDRFVSSTLAYQLGGDRLSAAEIRSVANVAIAGRWPDQTILLDMPPAQGASRIQRKMDRIERRPPEYHERVRAHFLAQAAADPDHFRVINGAQDRQAVHREIWQALGALAGESE